MFSKRTEIFTLDDWKEISKVKKGDLIWDGDDFRRVKSKLTHREVPIGYVENWDAYGILCSESTEFLMERGWLKASELEPYEVAKYLQEGEELQPSLKFRPTEFVNPLEKLYSLELEEPYNILVVKLDYRTCLYAKAS